MPGDSYKIWADPNKRRIFVRIGVGVGEHEAGEIVRDLRRMVEGFGPGGFDVVSDLRASPGVPASVIAPMAAMLRWLVAQGMRRAVRVVLSDAVADQFHRVSRTVDGYRVDETTSLIEAERLLDEGAFIEAPLALGSQAPEASLVGPPERTRVFTIH